MRLTFLLKALDDYKIYFLNKRDPEIKGISSNSKEIKPGFLFVAIKGEKFNGNDFIEEALENGAEAILSENEPILNKTIWIKVKDARQVLAQLLNKFYDYPSKKIKVVGVTGTNGKTTVTYLLEKIIESHNSKCAVIGTINYRLKDKVIPATNTTPSIEKLVSLLNEMVKNKINYLVMEVSSHALAQKRTEGIDFYSAIFTNLSREHLDYHRTIEEYFKTKLKLFSGMKEDRFVIINNDDTYGRRIRNNTKAQVFTYGIKRKADFLAEDIKFGLRNTEFKLKTKNFSVSISVPLIGEYNVYNVLAAISWAIKEGIDISHIKMALQNFKAPPGRLERVESRGDFEVFIDYAHTEQALKNVLSTLRKIASGKIILVFGCGGDRDKSKRPRMGRIATELADFVFITNDNPRSEDPLSIIEDIKRGIKKDNYKVIPDRYLAIKEAISLAKPLDIVLVAGKGHENYQIIKDKIIPFDDHQVIKECLQLKN